VLKTLTVSNFALIEQTTVEFTEGLNILTGETGAGKSILIDALSIILGNRASVDYIRTGKEYFRIEAIFDLTNNSVITRLLEEQDIAVEEDGTFIISRRLSRHGRNSITMNGCHVTLGFLRQIGEKLVDMHGQHENQALLRPETHLPLLDAYDSLIKEKLEQYRYVYQKWLELNKELSISETNSRDRIQRLDMLKWQTEEIAAASLKPNEDEDLEREIKILANAEKIAGSFNRAYSLLSQGSKGFSGVLDALAEVKRELETAVRYDERTQVPLAVITDTLYQLEECSRDLRDYCEGIEFNPQRLAQLQNRMDLIYKLRKKYGPTIDDILTYYQQAVAEITTVSNYDEYIVDLTKQKGTLEIQLTCLVDELHTLRCNAATEMAEAIQSHLVHLGMPKAKMIIEVTKLPQFNLNGRSDVTLLFSANKGEEPKAVHKIASGGELSRIALALKTVCSARDSVGTMVFDEIDTGIGGQTAQMVAERIAMVALHKQVLCITHLSQIACMADSHIYIEKQVSEESTNTVIRRLNKSEQLTELARMMGGDVTRLAVENATQMLDSARIKKEKWKNKAQA